MVVLLQLTTDTIEYVTIASEGNPIDFGDLTDSLNRYSRWTSHHQLVEYF